MSGLDGLIGAEERIINSKGKISDSVVRGLQTDVSAALGVEGDASDHLIAPGFLAVQLRYHAGTAT